MNGTYPLSGAANGPYSGEAGQTIQFTSTVSGGVPPYSDYHWDFGDGETSTEANPTHTYSEAGTYDVTFSVNDSEGSSATDTTTCEVEAPISETVLELGTIEGGVGIIYAEIYNSGEITAENIEWKLSVFGGILGYINVTTEGDEDNIDAEKGVTVTTDKLLFGIGKIDIELFVSADNAQNETETASAFIFGPFIFGL